MSWTCLLLCCDLENCVIILINTNCIISCKSVFYIVLLTFYGTSILPYCDDCIISTGSVRINTNNLITKEISDVMLITHNLCQMSLCC